MSTQNFSDTFPVKRNMDVLEKSRNYNDSLMSYWLFPFNTDTTAVLEDCLALAARISTDFIWHNDNFCLKVVNHDDQKKRSKKK